MFKNAWAWCLLAESLHGKCAAYCRKGVAPSVPDIEEQVRQALKGRDRQDGRWPRRSWHRQPKLGGRLLHDAGSGPKYGNCRAKRCARWETRA